MVDWALTFARDLALAVWLGGLIVIDFVETPARFRVGGISRNQVVAIGRAVFATFNRTEAVVGAVLLAAGALLLTRAETNSSNSLMALTAVGLMWLVALTQFFWARPRMSAVVKELDLDARGREDERFQVLRRWHKAYVALDILKAALGLAALGLWA